MNFNDSFYYSLKYYFRNKKELITTFLVAIVLSLIIFAFSFHKSLNKYWDDSMTKLVDYRTFFVYYDDTLYDENRAIEKLKKYNHIESISPFSSYLIPMTANDYIADDKNSSFFLLGAQGNPIDVYKGKNLSSYKSDDMCRQILSISR